MVHLVLVLVLFGVARAQLYTPWNVTDCTYHSSSCHKDDQEARDCDRICFENRTCEIRVAAIFPDDPFYIVNLEEAVTQLKEAENRAKQEGLIHPNVSIKYVTYDDKCEQEYATSFSMFAYFDNCVHVAFGPICDLCVAGAGRITKFLGAYGTPLVTPGGFSFDFTKEKTSCSDEFYMLLNTAMVEYRSYAEFFHYLLIKFGWQKIAFMYEKEDLNEVAGTRSCQLMLSSIIEILKTDLTSRDDGDIQLANTTYRQYFLNSIGTNYGIIATCMTHQNLRQALIQAYDLNLIGSGEYIFFNFEMYNNATIPAEPWRDPNDTDENNEIVRMAYRSVYTLGALSEAQRGQRNETEEKRGSIHLEAVYDGMLMYAHVINRSLKIGEDGLPLPNQTILGKDVLSQSFGLSYKGKNDNVTINCNGLRVAYFAITQMNADLSGLETVATYDTYSKSVSYLREFRWPSGEVPSDTPKCGFDMSLCPPVNVLTIILVTVCVCVPLIVIAISVLLYRRYKLEAEIASMSWRVHWDDIIWLPNTKLRSSFHSTGSLTRRGSQTSISVMEVCSLAGERQLYTTVGYYKAIRVAVKKLEDAKFELNRAQLLELKVMKDLSSDHLVKFYGACLDSPNCCILTEYCPRGSLQDILENDEVKLDWVFRMSLIHDIIKGMHYLHSSPIKTHGALKSSNCLVDSRFVLKIADFGLHFLRIHAKDDSRDEFTHSFWERQLWTAPELLRTTNPSVAGTQKGDVYSFAIIVHEIVTRQGVFYLGEDCKLSKKEIVDGVRNGPDQVGTPVRPLIDENTCDDDVAKLMKQCWAEDPADRPDFTALKNTIRKLNKEYDSGNVLDNLLSRMAQYANNLETLVEERTVDYLEEKRKCEELLYQLLPKSVAQQLITGESVIAETFDQVTIYFSDIVGFTALSAQSTPLQVVDLLNDLYTCFDSIIENFDVYKVETIGDAYMVVSGLPERNGNKHAGEIARMSLALLNQVKLFKIRHRPDEPLRLRIGIHTGPCVAGVVGLKMPRYCLFGDTVNTASRMESNGLPLKIHVSPATKEVLDTFGTFELECRGEVEMKGKGKMTTYWLLGERADRRQQTPAPARNRNVSLYAMSSEAGASLNKFGMEGESGKLPPSGDEADLPVLSITSPSDQHSHA